MADPISTIVSAQTQRPIHTFNVPAKYGDAVKSVGLVELTAREEIEAARRGNNDAYRIKMEQIMQALVEVNGARVGLADGSADKALNEMHPAVRTLVVSAYQQVSDPPEADVKDFLASQTVKVG